MVSRLISKKKAATKDLLDEQEAEKLAQKADKYMQSGIVI